MEVFPANCSARWFCYGALAAMIFCRQLALTADSLPRLDLLLWAFELMGSAPLQQVATIFLFFFKFTRADIRKPIISILPFSSSLRNISKPVALFPELESTPPLLCRAGVHTTILLRGTKTDAPPQHSLSSFCDFRDLAAPTPKATNQFFQFPPSSIGSPPPPEGARANERSLQNTKPPPPNPNLLFPKPVQCPFCAPDACHGTDTPSRTRFHTDTKCLVNKYAPPLFLLTFKLPSPPLFFPYSSTFVHYRLISKFFIPTLLG